MAAKNPLKVAQKHYEDWVNGKWKVDFCLYRNPKSSIDGKPHKEYHCISIGTLTAIGSALQALLIDLVQTKTKTKNETFYSNEYVSMVEVETAEKIIDMIKNRFGYKLRQPDGEEYERYDGSLNNEEVGQMMYEIAECFR
jgi:hypothetical protein